MGGTHYSDAIYTARVDHSKKSGKPLMDYDDDYRKGKVTSIHDILSPSKLNAAGKNVRESFDSDAHPTSRAVAVLFDVTGSMGRVPKIFITKLDKLMALLIKKGYLEHPHVLFGAIGDATCDSIPLQIGQFEAGNEMDETLSKIVAEGGGGGQTTESYELAMYYMARHTDLDCLNKRGDKGYLFILGDERPYPQVKRSEVQRLIGDNIETNISTEDILAELREKFEVFWAMPSQGSYSEDSSVVDPLKKMFGQNFLRLDNADDVCELIASTIGVAEGFDIHDVAAHLSDVGTSKKTVDSVSKSLATFVGGRVAKSTVDGTLPKTTGADDVTRL